MECDYNTLQTVYKMERSHFSRIDSMVVEKFIFINSPDMTSSVSLRVIRPVRTTKYGY